MLFFLFFFALFAASSAKEIRPRIIGGEHARSGQFPFIAAVTIRTQDSVKFCGGSLVDAQWILTTAFCASNAINFEIQLGSNQLKGADPNRVTLSTSEFVIHPDYNPDTLENDIALIKLRMPITFNDYAQKIAISSVSILNDTLLETMGWGQISDTSSTYSNDLIYVELAVIPNIQCQLVFGTQITDNMVCLEGNFNEGICNGDSGGPLIERIGRAYYLVGVGSFISGNGCESSDPSGFTRTLPYLKWIESYLKN